jgi:hypothetical protein
MLSFLDQNSAVFSACEVAFHLVQNFHFLLGQASIGTVGAFYAPA